MFLEAVAYANRQQRLRTAKNAMCRIAKTPKKGDSYIELIYGGGPYHAGGDDDWLCRKS